MAFVRERLVRFDEVDFARVVYYPRFFGYTHEVFEDFFAAEVGVSYPDMLQLRGIGFPTVHVEADFRQPLKFGDRVRIQLEVGRVSPRSIACHYDLSVAQSSGEVLAAKLLVVTVPILMGSFQATTTPDDVAAAFSRHLRAESVLAPARVAPGN